MHELQFVFATGQKRTAARFLRQPRKKRSPWSEIPATPPMPTTYTVARRL